MKQLNQSNLPETNLPNPELQSPAPAVFERALPAEMSSTDNASRIREVLEAGLDGTPDGIFCFSGSIKRIGTTESYRTLVYSDLNEVGLVTGSRSRVIATAEIAKVLPGVPIITNSFNRYDANEPTMASVVEKELVNRGVDHERISREEKSFSTATQLIEMLRISNLNGWNKVVIVDNEWHFPRMKAMFSSLETVVKYADPKEDAEFNAELQRFRDRQTRVNFVGSETVMRIISSHYGSYLDAAERTEAFNHSMASEAKGLADLAAGTYHVTLQPEKARDDK